VTHFNVLSRVNGFIKLYKYFEKIYSGYPTEGLYAINLNNNFKWMSKFFQSSLNLDKEEVENVKFNEDKTLLKQITSDDNLPIEYDGELEITPMIESMKEKLEEKRELCLLDDEMCLNLDLYPESVREFSVDSIKYSIADMIANQTETVEGVVDVGALKTLAID
jgi:hypothetical protein